MANTRLPRNRRPKVNAPQKADKPYAQKDSAKTPDLSVLNSWLEYGKEAAQKKHWEFFVIDQFLRGNHDIRGNPDDNTIIVGTKTDRVNYPINKIYSTFRAVRGYVTRHKPKIEVDPDDSMPDAVNYARRANLLIERDNKLNNGRKLNKEWVYYGIKYGIGWRQMGYDTARQCTIRWSVDPFDLLPGTKSGDPLDAPYLVKTFVRTIKYWRNKYPNANVVPDNLIAADDYKQLSLKLIYDTTQVGTQPLDEQTAVGYEAWYRLYEPNKMGGLVNKCIFTKTELVDVEETPYTEFPFIPYQAEIVPNETYPDGHLKHVIAPQRMLNLLNMQLLEYNHLVNRGRFQMERDSGFKIIYAKEGQIIQTKAGKVVKVLNPPGINPALPRQVDYSLEFIEDIGGQHDASIGATPARVTSGNAIEALQTGDSNNISDLRDNFEDSLSMEATWILKMYSLFEKKGVMVNDKQNGKDNLVGMVGQQAYESTGTKIPKKYYSEDNGGYCDICSVLPENRVNVSVVSQLGETKEARLDLMFKLVDAGVPLKVLLEHLEFPNTPDILQRIAEESVADMQMDQLKAQMSQSQVPGGPGAPGGNPLTPPPGAKPGDAVPPPPGAQGVTGGGAPDNGELIKALQGISKAM